MDTLTIRRAIFEDYNAACTFFENVDQLYAGVLPDLFQCAEYPARSRAWFTQIGENPDASSPRQFPTKRS